MRWTLGPLVHSATRRRIAPSDASAKPDVQASVKGYDESAEAVTVSLPAYDPAQFNGMSAVRAYVIPSGETLLPDGDAYLASSYPFAEEDVSTYTEGVDVSLSLPPIPEDVPLDITNFVVQILQGYAV